MIKKGIFIFLCLISFFLHAAENTTQTLKNSQSVELNFFWSRHCPHCLEAKPFIETLAKRYSWLKLNSYDLIKSEQNVYLYINMAKQLNRNANSVPGFIFCGQMMVGFDKAITTGKEIEKKLLNCYQKKQPKVLKTEESFDIPFFGKLDYKAFSLPLFTLIIAALDAFNPCAFFVLFFLLSLIAHAQNRLRIAMIGGTFVFFSGLMYFIFMAAWLNLFLVTEELGMITAITGVIAILIGIINVKDYFFFKQGVSLSIPESAKPSLFQRMRIITQTARLPAMLVATSVLAIVANSYELLCTAGLPMIYTRILTLNELSSMQYYLYLVLYNIIYIVPLLLIVVLFTITLGSRKLTEKEGRLLKLLSGNMMLALGGLLFFAPALLNNMLVSILIIVLAVFLTCVFVYGNEVKANNE